jgi:multiple sugar transport system permease protein
MSLHSIARQVYKDRYGYFFIVPGYVFFTIFMLVPVIAAIGLSFFDTNYVKFTWVGLGNFLQLARNPDFIRALTNTLTYVGVVVPVTLVLSLLIALLVFPLNPKLQTFFRGAFYLPGVAGGVMLSLVWIWIFNPAFGFLNFLLTQLGLHPVLWLASSRTAIWSVILVVLTFTIGQPIILFLAGLGSIPGEIYDAALVDGANRWQRVWFVTLPLLRPVFMFVLATTTIGVFQIWETIYMLTSGGPAGASTSIVYMIYETAFLTSKYGLASAMGVVLMAFIVIITFFQLRFWDVSYLE